MRIPFEKISGLRAALAEAKTTALVDMVEDYEDAGTPVVVFSAHRFPIDTLAKREGWAVITGGTNPTARTAIVEAFQEGSLKGIGLTIRAGCEGLTLTHASHMILVDLEWSPGLNRQAMDRIRRLGQKNACSVQILVGDHPLEERIAALLARKQETIDRSVETIANTALPAKASDRYTAALAQIAAAPVQKPSPKPQEAAPSSLVAQGKTIVFRERTSRSGKVFRGPLTAQEHHAAEGAITLTAMDSDRASARNGMGWNKIDGEIGHDFSGKLLQGFGLSAKQWGLLVRIVRKYARQVGPMPKG